MAALSCSRYRSGGRVTRVQASVAGKEVAGVGVSVWLGAVLGFRIAAALEGSENRILAPAGMPFRCFR